MNARIWKLAAAFAVASVAACSSSKDSGHAPPPSGPSISLTPSTTAVVANGTNTVTLTVTDTGAAAVTVTTDHGTLNGGVTSYVIPAGTGATTGTVTLTTCNSGTSGTCAGVATVRATSTTGTATASITFSSLATACLANCGADAACAGLACTLSGGGSGTCSASSPPVCTAGTAPSPNARLGAIAVPPTFATPTVLGVKTSGWNELGSVAVQVLDEQGNPWADGLTVHFEHRQLGGSTFGPPLGTCAGTPAPPDCVAYDATTVKGVATAPILSGTVAGTLVLTASATVGTDSRSVTLPGIAVVGAKASGANFSIQCSPRNVPALGETDCSTSWVDAPITCVALLKDRFNNLLGTSTQVIFGSEAAAVGQVAWTPAYDPTKQGADQKDLGTAVQIFQTLGAGLPFDVAPIAGEPSWTHAADRCGVTTSNPRDGVVTLIAIADGEEAFFDSNGNGKYDGGEPFVDQGEPFIDQNDNGQWDPGEWFLDVNGDSTYTPANGSWDAQAKIWTQTVVIYSGSGATVVAGAGPVYLGNRWVDAATYAGTCAPSAKPADFALTALNPRASYWVVASDYNLNFLSTGTKYSVDPVGKVNATATYTGLDKIADLLGMSYRYWPCDQSGACASQCRATGANAPCRMMPSLSGFSCGYGAGVTIDRGQSADVGTIEFDWNVVTSWQRYGSGVDFIVSRPQRGTSP